MLRPLHVMNPDPPPEPFVASNLTWPASFEDLWVENGPTFDPFSPLEGDRLAFETAELASYDAFAAALMEERGPDTCPLDITRLRRNLVRVVCQHPGVHPSVVDDCLTEAASASSHRVQLEAFWLQKVHLEKNWRSCNYKLWDAQPVCGNIASRAKHTPFKPTHKPSSSSSKSWQTWFQELGKAPPRKKPARRSYVFQPEIADQPLPSSLKPDKSYFVPVRLYEAPPPRPTNRPSCPPPVITVDGHPLPPTPPPEKADQRFFSSDMKRDTFRFQLPALTPVMTSLGLLDGFRLSSLVRYQLSNSTLGAQTI